MATALEIPLMNTLPLILTCLASGAVGAGAMKFIGPAPQADRSAESLTEIYAKLDSMQSTLERQDSIIRDQSDELDRMASETQLVPFTPERTLVTDVVTGGDEVSAMDASSEAIKIGENRISQAQFQNWVRQANANLEAEERAKRDEERKIRDGERTEERVAALTTELGLDSRQQSEFRRHFEDQNTKRRDMMQAMRDGTIDRGEMREAWGTYRDEANADLQTFLSGDQYERYQESDNNDGNRFGRRGGGGNRGGNGATQTGGNTNTGGTNAAGGGGRRGGNNGAAGGGRRGGF